MLRERYLTSPCRRTSTKKWSSSAALARLGKRLSRPKSWENDSSRLLIIIGITGPIAARSWPPLAGDADLIILDEIHKLRGWKNWLGEYDKLKDRYKFLVTGSARLDIVRGREIPYRTLPLLRLHPFSLRRYWTSQRRQDFRRNPIAQAVPVPEFEMLSNSGIPEPFFGRARDSSAAGTTKKSSGCSGRYYEHRADSRSGPDETPERPASERWGRCFR